MTLARPNGPGLNTQPRGAENVGPPEGRSDTSRPVSRVERKKQTNGVGELRRREIRESARPRCRGSVRSLGSGKAAGALRA